MFHKLFHIHPQKGCFLSALRIHKPRTLFRHYSTILRPLFSYSFPSFTTYLLPHKPYFAGEVTNSELSRDMNSFWIFLQIWTGQKSGHSGRKVQVVYCVCGSIKSNSEAALSTPSLELYNFLNLLIFCRLWWVARAPASRCSLHWNTSQVMAGSKSLMGSRLQTRTQVNIWASVQNIMKKYLNFTAGKCSKQDKMLKMTNQKKKTVQMTFTNWAYLNTETQLTIAVHL